MSEARGKHFKVLFSLNEKFGFDQSTGHHLMFNKEGLRKQGKTLQFLRLCRNVRSSFIIIKVRTIFLVCEVKSSTLTPIKHMQT